MPVPLPVMPWLHMPMFISSETIIADCMVSPITVAAFPSMKAVQPEWIADQPNVARSQIIILITNDTDVFITVPSVTVGHPHGRRSHHHWCRGNYEWLERHLPIWLNDTACDQSTSHD